MKKLFIILATFAALVLSYSCQKDPVGGTRSQALAGQWYVTVDGADKAGNVTLEDPFGMGRFIVLTYNTTDDNGIDLFLDDLGNFWEFKVKTTGDVNSLTFAVDKGKDLYNGIDVTVTGGKITPGGATTPSGQPADAIEFYVTFSDDSYIGEFYDQLKFSGFRYTGLANDD